MNLLLQFTGPSITLSHSFKFFQKNICVNKGSSPSNIYFRSAIATNLYVLTHDINNVKQLISVNFSFFPDFITKDWDWLYEEGM